MTHPSNHGIRLLLAARLSAKPKKDADGNRRDQGLGIETQDELAREWAVREGHVIVDTAADTKSGTVAPWDRENLRPWTACGCTWCREQDDKRGVPDKKRIYDGAKITMYDGVLAFKTDRLSRGDQEDFSRIEMWATHHGKKLIIVNGPQYPARDDSDYWSWTAEKRQARKEWESSRERNARSRARLIKDNAVVTKPPFGLVIDGERYAKTVIPTDEGRKLVPEVFDRIIAGESLGEVSRWLTEVTERSWYRQNVRDMIYCTTYMGEQRDRSGKTILKCEPLLVTETGGPDWARFHLAQKMLSAHPKRGPRSEGRAMLSGVLFCGNPDCTVADRDEGGTITRPAPMYRAVNRWKGHEYVYYMCHGRGPEQKTRRGCGNRVRLDWADAAADRIIAETQDRPVVDYTLVPGDDHEAEKQHIRESMAQLPLEELDDAEFDARMAQLRRERDRVNALEPVPARYDVRETGEGTYAEVWARLDTAGRSTFLAKRRFRVYATKEFVRLERGESDWYQGAAYHRDLDDVVYVQAPREPSS